MLLGKNLNFTCLKKYNPIGIIKTILSHSNKSNLLFEAHELCNIEKVFSSYRLIFRLSIEFQVKLHNI